MRSVTLAVEVSCTACGACVATCPTAALLPAPRRPDARPDRCTACLACVEVCPVDALVVGEEPRP